MTLAQNSSALYSNHDLSIASTESEFSVASPEATLSDSSSTKCISPATTPPGPLRSDSPSPVSPVLVQSQPRHLMVCIHSE